MYSYALAPDAGRRIELAANVMTLKASARETDGAFSQMHYSVPAGFPGPELHTHPMFDEAFFVLDGQLDIRIGDSVETLGPGGFAYVRGSEPHTFANSSDDVATVMITCTPGGFEGYFEELAEVAAGGMPDAETRSRISAKYGVKATG